ncbi:TIGR00725 family protein [Coleofasciculus sp. FACHB-64]|uniref:TIGR00725 family protein n=1 Tax=Cyanophyceae TaxID=3028117 RepID=UPI001687BF08|nr:MULTISPECIES: TIGR00725 family protein [unclassified Coleofasciculus]MBD1837284.1 TIGR00725 family protein [Coleofasciculus sp. FACHB-501]MBD1882389.1 TIGR00725 family protein [Coleofasciculus sp. FACHB-T130]MBD2044832.1 TIGR00725 family protein [Coleofasciculus sp. FACHB-64]
MKKTLIGVMGPGANATETDLENAYKLGQFIAQEGWVLLTGGRNAGVMDAASKGAKFANGLTIGVLPTNDTSAVSDAVDIAIVTDMGNARNNINVLSSDVVIACGMGAGTASEIALALKNHKKVILLTNHPESKAFFQSLSEDSILIANTPAAAIEMVRGVLSDRH